MSSRNNAQPEKVDDALRACYTINGHEMDINFQNTVSEASLFTVKTEQYVD